MRLPEQWRELLALIPGYDSEATAEPTDYFDPEAAELALAFFPECLQFIEGERAGEPFNLEPWQQAIVAALFGWKREDGTRRYRECLLYVPRKSGKTPFCAGLALLVAFTDGEPGAQCYAASGSREQASLLFRHAAGMLAREPMMAKRARVYKSLRSIEFPATNTIFRALASDADRLHGLNVHLALIDEVHSFPNSDLVDVLTTATSSRKNPLIVYLTTADFERQSICNQKHDYACKVRDGDLQDRAFLPVIYEARPDEDWTSPEVWAKANPNLGVSVKLEYLERECRRAIAEASYEGVFRRFHLNQRTSVQSRWIRVEDWDACKVELPDLTKRPCYAALDLSTKVDLTALTLVFPPLPGETLHYVLPFFWLPEERLKDRRDRAPYALWARQGYLLTTPGNVVDYEFIRAKINELGKKYRIQEIRFDPFSAQYLATNLESDGFTMTEQRQGWSMNEPTKELERHILGRTLGHDGHPILRWNVENVTLRLDHIGNVRPDKSKAVERIDGAIALIMSVGGAAANKPRGVPRIHLL